MCINHDRIRWVKWNILALLLITTVSAVKSPTNSQNSFLQQTATKRIQIATKENVKQLPWIFVLNLNFKLIKNEIKSWDNIFGLKLITQLDWHWVTEIHTTLDSLSKIYFWIHNQLIHIHGCLLSHSTILHNNLLATKKTHVKKCTISVLFSMDLIEINIPTHILWNRPTQVSWPHIGQLYTRLKF
jgi:hypothetical protein